MQNIVLYSLAQTVHKYCQQQRRKLNFENFNDVIRAYRKYFQKSCCSMIDAEFSSLFTGANCALVLLIVMQKLNVENFNDVIRAYRKYFGKSCLQTKCVEFDSVLPATNCSSISLTVLGLFAFKGIYDVIFVNPKLHKNGKRYVVFDDTLLKASVFLFLLAACFIKNPIRNSDSTAS